MNNGMHAGRSDRAREFSIGVALTAAFLILPVIAIAYSNFLQRTDFSAFYTSGLMVRQGNAAKLYDLTERGRVQGTFLGHPGMTVNPYPPFQAVLFGPLAGMSFRAAYIIWGLLNVLLLFVFGYLFRDRLGATNKPMRYLLGACLFWPLLITLIQGQFSILVLVSFALAFLLIERNREYEAGLALGLGLIKFQVVLPLAFILAFRRKWKVMGGLTGMAAVWTVLSIMGTGLSGLVSYATAIGDVLKHPSNAAYAVIKPADMPTVRGFVTTALTGGVSQTWIALVSAAISGALILGIAWMWRLQEKRGSPVSSDVLFAAAVTVSLVAAPHLLVHDLTLMLLVFALLVTAPEWSAAKTERSVLRASMFILYLATPYLVARGAVWILAPVLFIIAFFSVRLTVNGTVEVQEKTLSQNTEVSRVAEGHGPEAATAQSVRS